MKGKFEDTKGVIRIMYLYKKKLTQSNETKHICFFNDCDHLLARNYSLSVYLLNLILLFDRPICL